MKPSWVWHKEEKNTNYKFLFHCENALVFGLLKKLQQSFTQPRLQGVAPIYKQPTFEHDEGKIRSWGRGD